VFHHAVSKTTGFLKRFKKKNYEMRGELLHCSGHRPLKKGFAPAFQKHIPGSVLSPGSVYDACVDLVPDLRVRNARDKYWMMKNTELTCRPGFSHGFCVLSDTAILLQSQIIYA
jgi:hypothetical protein